MAIVSEVRYVVHIRLKHGVSNLSDFRDYIKSAVGQWGGQFSPDDIFFPPNMKVTVRPFKEKK